jgi:HlyD family secretion protein
MTRAKIVLTTAATLAIAGAGGYGYVRQTRTNAAAVEVEPIRAQPLEAIVSASGKIQPKRLVNISADTMGRVTELAVNEGDRIQKGQFLLQVDPRNLRTQVAQTEASLEAARSTMNQQNVAIESGRAALNQAQTNLTRQQSLWKQGLTTRESLESAENTLRMRQADLNAQEKQIETQKLRMQQEAAQLENARYNLSKVRIESPIDGIITRRNIEEGETVVVGTMNNAGTVLLTVADMSIIEAQVNVDETDIPSVRLGQRTKVTVDAMPGKTFYGKVTEIGNSPIQTTGGTAATQATNFLVKVTLDETIPNVRPGFTCTADITTATREGALGVPIQATTVREVVLEQNGEIVHEAEPDKRKRRSGAGVAVAELKPGQERKELEGVFVVRDNRAVFTPLKTGIAGEKYFEVVAGLKEGDQVIVGPFASVRELADGSMVRAEPPARRTAGSGR